MEKIITSIVLLLCSILIIFVNRKYHKACVRRLNLSGKGAFFIDFIFDAAFYMVIINYLLPAITHIIFDYSVIEEENVTPYELVMVYVMETFSWLIFYPVFYSVCKNKHKHIEYSMQNNKSLEKITGFILILYLFSRLTTLGVQEDEPTVWEQRLFFIIPFVNLAGYMLAIFIVIVGKRYFSKFIWYLALFATGAYFMGAFLGGIRGFIVTPIVWAIYIAFKFLPKTERRRYYFVFGIALLLFLVIQPIFMGFREINKVNISLADKISMAQDIAANPSMQNTDNRYLLSNVFKELDYRYGAQGTYTVGFYRLVDKEGYVGLNCITNSFYTFIPSVLYGGDKPVSTSSDGTMDGMGMYKCVYAVNGSNNMCGFFTSGHAYWELGILGVILFSIIPALFDFWCIKLFQKLDIIGVALYTSILGKAFGEIKMWVSLIVVEFAQIILPMVLISWLYLYLKKKSKNIPKI